MPQTIAGYILSGGGTLTMGLLYRFRQGEHLRAHEWAILSCALALWGLVAYAIMDTVFKDNHSEVAVALLAVPLGVGISETFATLVEAIKRLFELLPDSVAEAVKKWRSK